MIPIRGFRTDAPVTEEQFRQVDEQVVILARRAMKGRMLLNIFGPLGFGVQRLAYDELTESSDAILTFAMTEDEDMVNLIRRNADIPILHKAFRLARRDLESSRRFGTPLDTAAAGSAGYRVGRLEDDLIINGYTRDGTNYDINGLYRAAGNDYSTASGFDTIANVQSAFAGAADLLQSDFIDPPYNAVLHPTQYNEALREQSAGAGISALQYVRENILDPDGQGRNSRIIVSTAQTAGTGMVLATPGANFFDLVVAQDVTTEMVVLEKTGDVFGRVFEAVVPRVRDSNAIARMSVI